MILLHIYINYKKYNGYPVCTVIVGEHNITVFIADAILLRTYLLCSGEIYMILESTLTT